MHFLIINDLVDVKNKKITHYSLDKGLNLGFGFVNNGCNVDYIVSTNSYTETNINFVNLNKINNTYNIENIIKKTSFLFILITSIP